MRHPLRPILALFAAAISVGSARAQSAPGFFAEVLPPIDSVRFGVIWPWFRDSGYLQQNASTLNQVFVLPRPVRLGAAECDRVDAFFRADITPPTVGICYEMLESIQFEFGQDHLSDQEYAAAQGGTLAFVLYHEIGHALVHEWNLPITGREEDVADQFAVVTIAREFPDAGAWAARFFREVGDPGHTGAKSARLDAHAFADEHALDEQRFYNVICWTYGADPANRQTLLQYLPGERAVRCPGEYRQLETAWRTLLSGHARTQAQAATSAPALAPAGPGLSGGWRYSEHVEQPATGIVCDDEGTLVLEGGTGSYAQKGTCTMNGRQIDNPGSGPLTGVVVDETTVRFRMGVCDYAGTLLRRSPEHVEGTVYCVSRVNERDVEARGTWVAER